MKLVVDLNEITLDDLEALESGRALMARAMRGRHGLRGLISKLFGRKQESGDWAAVRMLLASFAREDDGSPIAPEDAVKRVGQLKLAQVREASRSITEALREVAESAVPPRTGKG